jgi:hypothetical protein
MIPPVGKMAIVFGDVSPSAPFVGCDSAEAALLTCHRYCINILHRIPNSNDPNIGIGGILYGNGVIIK